MKAIQYYGPGDIRLEEIPEPAVGPGQVKIKVCAPSAVFSWPVFLWNVRSLGKCKEKMDVGNLVAD